MNEEATGTLLQSNFPFISLIDKLQDKASD